MIGTLILAASMTGQVAMRQCQTAHSYQRAYGGARVAYVAPVTYAAPTYYYPKAQVETTFVATELYEPQVYGTLVGAGVRAENRRKEDAATVAALTASVAGLTTAVRGLEARLGTAPVAPMPTPPGKPAPNPDVTPQPEPPPLPKTNPGVDDGSVPPPPTPTVPPTSSAGPGPDALAVFTQNCLKCHQDPAKAGKGYALFGKDGTFRSDVGTLDKISVGLETYTGNMPAKADPLDDKAISHLQAWIYSDPEAFRAFIKEARAKGLK